MNEESNKSTEILQKKLSILMKLRRYRIVGEEQKSEDLIDIIVQEHKTRKKLLIRLILKSKLSSGSIGVKRIRDLKKTMEKSGVDAITVGAKFTFSAKREARRNGIELISGEELPAFNIFKHKLVPKHEIMAKEEAEVMLKTFRIKPWQLPWIKSTDPAVRIIGAKPGDVLKITRKSPTAGKAVAYRYVT